MLTSDLFYKENTEINSLGVLWLPALHIHKLTTKLDWEFGLQISKLTYSSPLTWSPPITALVQEYQLPLDKEPTFDHDAFLINLPQGFSAKCALIHKSCSWSHVKEVEDLYLPLSKNLKFDFVQAPFIWSEVLPNPKENIRWIKI